MTERERGPNWDADKASQDERSDAVPIEGNLRKSVAEAEREAATERQRFMAALERVMSDHRNVLASLAK